MNKKILNCILLLGFSAIIAGCGSDSDERRDSATNVPGTSVSSSSGITNYWNIMKGNYAGNLAAGGSTAQPLSMNLGESIIGNDTYALIQVNSQGASGSISFSARAGVTQAYSLGNGVQVTFRSEGVRTTNSFNNNGYVQAELSMTVQNNQVILNQTHLQFFDCGVSLGSSCTNALASPRGSVNIFF